ncbi:hypothetical protein Tsp_07152 [Trichinella spiralis]|uniref:hypothetical protein n=1 Tax=Trichinella spiralis TaxID=6334 RepID=UPI0001EFBD51|nr:hypothetical protein Tsp_07152 [Trichinella spiralis]
MSTYFIRQSETRIDDDVKHEHSLLATCQPSCKQPLPYCSSDLHILFFILQLQCSSPSFSAGKISLVRSVSAALYYNIYNGQRQTIQSFKGASTGTRFPLDPTPQHLRFRNPRFLSQAGRPAEARLGKSGRNNLASGCWESCLEWPGSRLF